MERPQPILQKEKTNSGEEVMAKLLQIKTNVSLFQDFLPVLVGHFTDLCLEFKAGQIGACFAAWKELTKDGILL